jgi:hypothetical protein
MVPYLIIRLWHRALQNLLQCSEEENWRVIEEGTVDGGGDDNADDDGGDGGDDDDGNEGVKIISTEFNRGA